MYIWYPIGCHFHETLLVACYGPDEVDVYTGQSDRYIEGGGCGVVGFLPSNVQTITKKNERVEKLHNIPPYHAKRQNDKTLTTRVTKSRPRVAEVVAAAVLNTRIRRDMCWGSGVVTVSVDDGVDGNRPCVVDVSLMPIDI
jgi:hypothetical protein